MNEIIEGLEASSVVRILEQLGSCEETALLEQLTKLLARHLAADYVWVAHLVASNGDDPCFETACLTTSEGGLDNFRYAMLGAPCQAVMGNRVCIYNEAVSESFNDCEWLTAMNAETYIGVPLCRTDGQVVGVLAAVFKVDGDSVNVAAASALLQVFAGRAAAALQGALQLRQLEAELEKSRKLQDQYQILARQERDARNRAQKASRVKGSFVASMSQEIKTPMNAMLAFCQMLLKSDLDSNQRSQVQSVLDSGQALMAMLNDVMELSRLDEGVVELEEHRVASHQLFDNVIEQAESQLHQRAVSLHYCIEPSMPPYVVLAEHHVQKMLANLLSNAIAMTVQGDIQVNVSFAASSDMAGDLTVTVADTGAGFAPSALAEIFEPFASSLSTNSGLGMHLVQRCAAAMGGTVAAHSELGSGSVFTLQLPIALPEETLARAVATDVTVGLVCVRDTGSSMAQCLTFLGVKCLFLDPSLPIAPQANLHPITGVIVDLVSGSKDFAPLEHFAQLEQRLQEVRNEGFPLAVVASKKWLASANAGSLLEGLSYVQRPVLMHEWLRIIEGFAPAGTVALDTAATHLPAGERILLVEDNRLNQEIALCILEGAGYSVDVANNGQEAVDQMTRTPSAYQLVLMDIQMPIMDGLQATRIIRKQLGSLVPIVAVTAGIAVKDRKLCDEAGMNDFIPKPIDEDFVLQKVRYYTSGLHQAMS